MEALADSSALEARLGRSLTDPEAARAAALLADASARVRSWTHLDFTVVTDDVVTLRSDGEEIRLPQRPVTGVAKVIAVGTDGRPDLTLAGWSFDGIDRVCLAGDGTVINLPEWWYDADRGATTYQVTYSHGYDTVPDDVVTVVCAMVLRCLTAPTMAGGMTGETIGPYSYRSEAGVGTAVRLTDEDKTDLKDYRRTAGTTKVRAGVGVSGR